MLKVGIMANHFQMNHLDYNTLVVDVTIYQIAQRDIMKKGVAVTRVEANRISGRVTHVFILYG